MSAKATQQVDLKDLLGFLLSVQSYSAELIFGVAPGERLYHYTDLAALVGILGGHDLWLTHARYSNDDEELRYGAALARRVLDEARAAPPADAAAAPAVWADYVAAVADGLEAALDEHVYIACFCLQDDLLSQWRSYGANGTGASLAFDPAGFDRVTGFDSPHGGLMRLWKVFYAAATQQKIVRNALDFAYRHYAAEPPAARARRAGYAIRFFVPTFKHPDFDGEHECRLIFTPPPACPVAPRFRSARGMLVPYYSLRELAGWSVPARDDAAWRLPHWRLPVVGARVGPSPHKALNADGLRLLLAREGYDLRAGGVPVVVSATPYRG